MIRYFEIYDSGMAVAECVKRSWNKLFLSDRSFFFPISFVRSLIPRLIPSSPPHVILIPSPSHPPSRQSNPQKQPLHHLNSTLPSSTRNPPSTFPPFSPPFPPPNRPPTPPHHAPFPFYILVRIHKKSTSPTEEPFSHPLFIACDESMEELSRGEGGGEERLLDGMCLGEGWWISVRKNKIIFLCGRPGWIGAPRMGGAIGHILWDFILFSRMNICYAWIGERGSVTCMHGQDWYRRTGKHECRETTELVNKGGGRRRLESDFYDRFIWMHAMMKEALPKSPGWWLSSRKPPPHPSVKKTQK